MTGAAHWRSCVPRHPAVVPLAYAVEVPDVLAPIAVPGAVRLEEAVHARIVQKTSLGEAGAAHLALRASPEVAAKPLRHWRAESLLATIQDLRGQQVAHGLSQCVLAAAAAELHPGRQCEGELDELVVEEGLAPFHGARHRHAVEPRQEQLGKPLVQLEIAHALKTNGLGR